MPSRFHRGETVPKGLNRDEVLRLLATTEGDRAADLRDRAILMVLIAYGLRSGEVAGLQLDDLNWEEETLRVRRPKPGRIHHYRSPAASDTQFCAMSARFVSRARRGRCFSR